MFTSSDIKEHMQITGKDGIAIGLVDCLEGGTQSIKVTRDQGEHVHHWIPLAWVKKVDAKGVHVNKDAAEVLASWKASPPAMAV